MHIEKAPSKEEIHDDPIKQMEAQYLYRMIDLSLDRKDKPMFYRLTNMMKDQK
ncbi:IDEAL domain-containing protein [Peribacillus frigoritolerans]|uniref:IDEAL domain-containing protein n=1 Tax=Peribacillus frigoritolerans TaxID=450367 RepID=UPI0032B57BFC